MPDLIVIAEELGHARLRNRSYTVHELVGLETAVTRVVLHDIDSGPLASASRPMPDGSQPMPGGWNRILVEIEDIAATVAAMNSAGATFRNEIRSGKFG